MNLSYVLISVVLLVQIVKCYSQDDDDDYDDGAEEFSAKQAKKIANRILNNKKEKHTHKHFLDVTLTGSESFEDHKEGITGVKGRLSVSKGLGYLQKGGKQLIKASRDRLKQIVERMRKALTFIANKVSEKGKMIWDQIKKKAKDMKKDFKDYVKDTVKDFLTDIYEDAKEMAYEYFKAMLLEMAKEQTGVFCECPVEIAEKHADNEQMQNRGELKCKCCIKIPKFKTGCLIMRARPKLKQIVVSLKYNKIEFIKGKVTDSPKGPCAKVPADELRVCSPLPEELHILSICIIPGTIEMDNEETGAFTGCFTVVQEQMQLAFERCMSYDPDGIEDNDNYMVQIFHPDEL